MWKSGKSVELFLNQSLVLLKRRVCPVEGETERMFVLIWASLLFTVRGSDADTGMRLYCNFVMMSTLYF